MVRKILIPLFSLTVILTGAFAFLKLNYWERSVSIFSYKTFDRNFEGRGGRGDRGSGEAERRGDRVPGEAERRGDRVPGDEGRGDRVPGDFERRGDSLPGDYTRRGAESRAEFEGRRDQDRDGDFGERREGRSNFGPGSRDGRGHGRGDFRRGKTIRLRNVLWFLAVFASFTALAVYFDRIYLKIRKRKFGST